MQLRLGISERFALVLPFVVVIVFCTRLSAADNNSSCRWNGYDFVALSILPWTIRVNNGSNSVKYILSVCQPLNSSVIGCQKNTSACRIDGENGLSIGIFNPSLDSILTEDAAKRELTLTFEGENCSDSGKMRTFIIFKCGKTLGSPDFIDSRGCDTYFEWFTTSACKLSTTSTNINETMCYVYDADGHIRDLNPLINTIGSYALEMADNDDYRDRRKLYINVCRDMNLPIECRGSSSCLQVNSTYINTGSVQLHSPLQISSDGSLYINYATTVIQSECTLPSSTKIIFRCPHRGKGGPPRLISSIDCQYLIEWETEYSCPEKDLISRTCQLNQPLQNVNIDLSSLAKGRDKPYEINATDVNGKSYIYTINICSMDSNVSGVSCEKSTHTISAACQIDEKINQSLGQLDRQTLRYSDRQLSLIYEGGDPCSSGFHRKTVINFHCNVTAGEGSPEFLAEDSCTYIFDWTTQLACVSLPVDCLVSANGHDYDLSNLIRSPDLDNWKVSDSDEDIVLNICEELTGKDKALNCTDGSAICLMRKDTISVNLGQFKSSPTVDSESYGLKLEYTDGDVCIAEGKIKYSSTITFRCSPGTVESQPSLLRKTSSGCHYDLVWYTASACAKSLIVGQNCRIEDKEAGYSFDLSALSKPFDMINSYYNISSKSTNHDYYLNICGPVSGTACSGTNVGMCQVDRNNPSQVYSTGEANSLLHYFSGLLKLVYENGDSYHTQSPVYRKTEIEFLCDMDSGIGEPYFEIETNYTYNIEWLTAYACPPIFTECSFVDKTTKKRYDLSRLLRSDDNENWEIEFMTSERIKQKLYINVCRSVVQLNLENSPSCDSMAGVCLTELDNQNKEKVKLMNVGRLLGHPQLMADGNLLLQYRNGQLCNKSKIDGSRYSVDITLVCDKESKMNGPSIIDMLDECTYSVLWRTAFACSEDDVITGSTCSINDPITGYNYNLQPLFSDKGYSVNSTMRMFKLNICGPTLECSLEGVAVCDDRNQSLGMSNNSSLQLIHGSLQLVYFGPFTETGQTKVKIDFICNKLQSLDEVHLMFVEQQLDTYLFQLETLLACSSDVIECQAYDDFNNKYDLSPLIKTEGNWMIEDARRNKYYINVCQPINSVNSTKCPGVVGGCQVTANGDIFNMGFIKGKLSAPDRNTLTLLYENGDLCHKGTRNEAKRSTRIVFHCSVRHVPPAFVEESDNCEYVIEWQTPAACPIQHAVGRGCQVEDPLYHQTFDLSLLTNQGTRDYFVSSPFGNFTLNVCGALCSHDNDDCSKGAGACWNKGNTTINIGNYNDRLTYEDGELRLVYVDGKEQCNGKLNHTTTIVFTCDHKMLGSSGLTYIRTKSNECRHWFEWQTSLACLQFSQSDCSVIDSNGNTIDLSPLTLTDDNYEVESDKEPIKFIINICTTLVQTKGILCPPNSGACMIKMNENDLKKRYVSIGRMRNDILSFEDDHIILSYVGGDNCTNGQLSQTIILIECDSDAFDTKFMKPEYITSDADCNHHFLWKTRFACVLNVTTEVSSGDCSVKDSLTGYLYNLSGLAGSYIVDDDKPLGYQYMLSICGSPIISSCGSTVGSCQREKEGRSSFNAGQSNSIVTYRDGIISMEFSNGTICHHNNRPRTTHIDFICSHGDGKGKPVFVGENDDCIYFFSWLTDFTCQQKEIRCVAHSIDGDYDLSSLKLEKESILISSSSQSLTSIDPSVLFYYVGICRPLGPIQGKFCPPGAAICREDTNRIFMSLGSLDGEPVYDSDSKQVVLLYQNGNYCSSNSNLRWKTKLTFICQLGVNVQHSPELTRIDSINCEYHFDWKTEIVCPHLPILPDVGKPDSGIGGSCLFTDNRINYTYDFNRLSSVQSGFQSIDSRKFVNNKYDINLCGEFKEGLCRFSPVCRFDGTTMNPLKSYGSRNGLVTVFEDPNLKLSYMSGSDCDDSTKSKSVFIMECDRSTSLDSRPIIDYEDDCDLIVRWPTPFACLPVVKPCRFEYFDQTFDLSSLSLRSNSRKLDHAGNEYSINLCRGISDGLMDCGNDIAICRKDAHGAVQAIGRVNSQSVIIGKNPDENLVIEYSYQGHVTCMARISFVCSLQNEGPVIEDDIAPCSIIIQWKTDLVCQHENRQEDVDTVSSVYSDSKSTSQTGSHGWVIAISFLFSAALLIIVIAVLHQPNRRKLILGHLKRCFTTTPSKYFRYSVLSESTTEAEDSRLLHRNTGNIQHYDSDDDILL